MARLTTYREGMTCPHGNVVAERRDFGPVTVLAGCSDCYREMQERSQEDRTGVLWRRWANKSWRRPEWLN